MAIGTTTKTNESKVPKKKKRISKHVLKAREGKQESEQQASKDEGQSTLVKKAKKKKKRVVKDPSEAAQYLALWKNQRDAWKFNKNTQSWLIRHMYDGDKIDKLTFVTLLDYLKGLQGSTARRILADATRRALRYKEYEKQQLNSASQQVDDNNDKSGETKTTEKDEDRTEEGEIQKREEEEDRDRWTNLDDHGKRKEYKRARKILEVLKNLGE